MTKKSFTFLFLIIVLTGMVFAGGALFQRATAGPTVLPGSMQGGCYLEFPAVCKLYIQPFTIDIAPSRTLLAFRLFAGDQLIYDFAASETQAPEGEYTPSGVALDFAARCGQTYTLKLEARDSGDLEFVTIGQTSPFNCPSSFRLYLPQIHQD